MKTVKKILLVIIVTLTLLSSGSYYYIKQKFEPEPNYLSVKGESGRIPMIWNGRNEDALLIPIKFEGDSSTYYLQFDTGSPYTMLYKSKISKIKAINQKKGTASAEFSLGRSKISSKKFKILDIKNTDVKSKIIGTLGSDILEGRKSEINFKEGYVFFALAALPSKYRSKTFDFKYKSRRIIIPGNLNGKSENFLYDTGSSSYELLTNKDNWEALKKQGAPIKKEYGNSWGNVLTTYTTDASGNIDFLKSKIDVQQVTYVEGYSKMQYYMMKFSGMNGMLGNRIFFNHSIYIDAEQEKIAIE